MARTLNIYTVYNLIFCDFPAENTVYKRYIYGSGQLSKWCLLSSVQDFSDQEGSRAAPLSLRGCAALDSTPVRTPRIGHRHIYTVYSLHKFHHMYGHLGQTRLWLTLHIIQETLKWYPIVCVCVPSPHFRVTQRLRRVCCWTMAVGGFG